MTRLKKLKILIEEANRSGRYDLLYKYHQEELDILYKQIYRNLTIIGVCFLLFMGLKIVKVFIHH